MIFPSDFIWGCAASSYQIEGAVHEDGRGECIWERFSRTPGKVRNGDTGEVACDHYYRYPEDLALMKRLGFSAYRFSISWARIIPDGKGVVNKAGLDFYDRLVDEMLEQGLRPFATLYHWDMPQALEDVGGWSNPQIVEWFARYSDTASRVLGDRVKDWMTLNEPWCTAILGYQLGIHAPGVRDFKRAYHAAHHLLLAHGASVPVLRANVPNARVGIALNPSPELPASGSYEDRYVARLADASINRWYLDPVFKGSYPGDFLALAEVQQALEGVTISDISKANPPIDFLGINYYTYHTLEYNVAAPLLPTFVPPTQPDYTAMGWTIAAPYLTGWLVQLNNEYKPKAIYITENGAAFDDPAPMNGVVEDPRRVAYIRDHTNAVHAAALAGVPMAGYFVWSFMDNFEWAEGYDKRFGIVHVDFQTQQRTPKRSALFMQELMAASRR
jgi:beta-glucosidase